MKSADRFFTELYTAKRNPAAVAGKIGLPITWKTGVKMTPFWPLVALMRIAKQGTPYEVKVAYTEELGVQEGDVLTDSSGTNWHVEGVDQWDDKTLEVFAWLIHQMIDITVDIKELEGYIRKLENTDFDILVHTGLVQGMEISTADIQRTAVINAPKDKGLLAASIQKSVYEEMPTGWGQT